MKLELEDYNEIIKKYSEPSRKYHSFTHIEFMLGKVKELKMMVNSAQDIAILLHDVVYEIGSHKNEINSAEYAVNMLLKYKPHNVRQDQIDNIVLCILSTINHVPLCEDAKEIIDLDLIQFATDYDNYKKTIREEYSNLSEKQWKIARKKFLESMLEKKQLFYTDKCKQFEDIARNNIKKEIEDLS